MQHECTRLLAYFSLKLKDSRASTSTVIRGRAERLEALQKYETGMLSVERGMDNHVTNGQIYELVEYFATHDFRISKKFGYRLIEVLVSAFQLSVETSDGIVTKLSTYHLKINSDYGKAIRLKEIFGSERVNLYVRSPHPTPPPPLAAPRMLILVCWTRSPMCVFKVYYYVKRQVVATPEPNLVAKQAVFGYKTGVRSAPGRSFFANVFCDCFTLILQGILFYFSGGVLKAFFWVSS